MKSGLEFESVQGVRTTLRFVLCWWRMCLSPLVRVNYILKFELHCFNFFVIWIRFFHTSLYHVIEHFISVWGLEQAVLLPSSLGYQLHFNGTSMCICSALLHYLIVWESLRCTRWKTDWRYFHYCTSNQFDFPQQLSATVILPACSMSNSPVQQ